MNLRQSSSPSASRYGSLIHQRPVFTVGACLLVALGFDSALASPVAVPGVLPADAPAEESLVQRLGATFRRVHTAHFSIVTDAEAARSDPLGQTAEQTLADVAEFAKRLSLPAQPPSAKMIVVFFDRWADYVKHATEAGFSVDQTMPGFFAERLNRSLLFNHADGDLIRAKRRELEAARQNLGGAGGIDPAENNLAARGRRIAELERQLRSYEELIARTVIRHEVAHQILANFRLQPADTKRFRWLREGLAMQFESPAGQTNLHRLHDFLGGSGDSAVHWLRDLAADPAYVGPGSPDLPVRYARAWALVGYLVDQRPEQFAKFLRSTGASSENGNVRASLALFEEAFGPVDDAFQRAVVDHARRLGDRP